MTNARFSTDELARRRRASRRWAWALGAAVALIYAGGFFISR